MSKQDTGHSGQKGRRADAARRQSPEMEQRPLVAQGLRAFQPQSTPLIPNALPSMFQGLAPAQLDPVGTLRFPAGELRGMYSSQVGGKIVQTSWKPQWSKFGHPRGGGGHTGVDIHAPVGTPIVAVVDGAVTFHAAGNSEIGNRAWLSFKIGKVSHRLIYGHLQSFSGNDRSVKRGELIGYAGCSGNADYALDCLAPGKCGISSSHVHLMLKNDATGQDLDAAAALGWTLRYADDLREVPCSDVMPSPIREHSIREATQHLIRLAAIDGQGIGHEAIARFREDQEALAIHPTNVDLSAPEADRARTMYGLLGAVVDDLDATKPADHRENIRRFLLHLAWHESDRLRTRKQYGNGPARSLFQFESHRARDELLFLGNTGKLSLLTASAGTTEAELSAAATALPNAPTFPAGNRITALMEQNDQFAARLARLAFRRFAAPVPSDAVGHAEYWYTYWKRTGGDPDSLKRTFAAAAVQVDRLIGLSPAPNFYLLRPAVTEERSLLAGRWTRDVPRLSLAAAGPTVSDRAVALIEHHESGGFDYYTRFAAHPYWPGVVSGLTIGFGFDLGYRSRSELESCFGVLGPAAIERLAQALGVHAGQGQAAKRRIQAWVAAFADITIDWHLAQSVLRTFDIPRYAGITRGAFPVQGLNPDQFGALVSLVFNRGTRLTGDRREEMAGIHAALAAGRPGEVPALIRAMKRLWPETPSLQRRREDEARLFEGT